MSGKRVLITGASGLLGGYLVRTARSRSLDAAFASGTTPGGHRGIAAMRAAGTA